MKKFLLALLFVAHYVSATPLVTITVPAEASGDVYFATTGNDSGNNCQTKASPCATPARAISQLTSGHNIWCATGSYTMPTTMSGSAIISGSSGAPVFFGPYAGQTCTLTIPVTTSSSDPSSDGIVVQNLNYWTFHDLAINYTYRAFNFNKGSGAHWQWYKNTFHQIDNGNTSKFCTSANCGAVFVGDTDSSAVDYFDFVQNVCYGDSSSGNGNNACVFYFDGPRHLNTIGNLIHGFPDAIHYKFDTSATSSSQVSQITANNIIYGTTTIAIQTERSWAKFYNNVISRFGADDSGIYIADNGGVVGGHDSDFQHNTFYKAALVIASGGDSSCKGCNINFTNNAFTPSPTTHYELQIAPYGSTGSNKNESLVNNNNYWPVGGQVQLQTSITGYATYNSAYSQGANDVARNAIFVGSVTSSPQIPANWAMTNPQIGSDGLPMGVVAGNLLTTNSLDTVTVSPPSAPAFTGIVPM